MSRSPYDYYCRASERRSPAGTSFNAPDGTWYVWIGGDGKYVPDRREHLGRRAGRPASSIAPAEKFCLDCKHHFAYSPRPYGNGCGRFRDLVTGEQLVCRWLRMAGAECGPEGKGFEPKENK